MNPIDDYDMTNRRKIAKETQLDAALNETTEYKMKIKCYDNKLKKNMVFHTHFHDDKRKKNGTLGRSKPVINERTKMKKKHYCRRNILYM